MPRPHDVNGDAPRFGRWSIDLATGEWTWSDELIAMYDTGLSNPGDVSLIFEAMHPDDRAAIEERLAVALVTHGPLVGQYRLDTRTRGPRVFSFVGDVERDADQQAVRLSGYAVDVTEEMREATREAVDAATRHRRAIEQVKGALMISYRIDEVTAFGILRTHSNEHNVKMNELAEHVSRAMSAGTPRSPIDGGPPMLEVLESVARRLHASRRDAAPEMGLDEAN